MLIIIFIILIKPRCIRRQAFHAYARSENTPSILSLDRPTLAPASSASVMLVSNIPSIVPIDKRRTKFLLLLLAKELKQLLILRTLIFILQFMYQQNEQSFDYVRGERKKNSKDYIFWGRKISFSQRHLRLFKIIKKKKRSVQNFRSLSQRVWIFEFNYYHFLPQKWFFFCKKFTIVLAIL